MGSPVGCRVGGDDGADDGNDVGFNVGWFGLIFWGSIFNALALNFGFDKNPLFFYIIGFLFGLLAKLRGTWLWKT